MNKNIQDGRSILLDGREVSEIDVDETETVDTFASHAQSSSYSTESTETFHGYNASRDTSLASDKTILDHADDSDEKTQMAEPLYSGNPLGIGRSTGLCVGWLLAITGPSTGSSFNIYSGRNSLGRGTDDRIRITGDDFISRTQAFLIYDPEENDYSITPGNGTAITRVNGKRVDFSTPLVHGDIIALSKKTHLRFIPACDNSFCWKNDDN